MRMKEMKNKELWNIERLPRILSTRTEYGKDVEEAAYSEEEEGSLHAANTAISGMQEKGQDCETAGKKIYAVTGAFGHLGNTIVRALLKRGERVRALALPGDACSSLENRDSGQLEIFRGDVRDPDTMDAFFRREEESQVLAIHAAGIVTIASDVKPIVYDVNVNGTLNVIRSALRQRVASFLYVSSVHALPVGKDLRVIREFSAPEDFQPELVEGGYAKTKAAATRLVLEAAREGLPARVVHPSGIIGPWDEGGGNHLMEMIRSYLNRKLPACVRGGYDFVDVRDVAEGCIDALEKGRPGECYILSNRHYDMKEILRMLGQISGIRRACPALPLKLAAVGVPFCEWNARRKNTKPLYTQYSLRVLRSNDKFSHEKADRELGYHPRDLYDTLKDTVKWMASSGMLKKADSLSFAASEK